MKDYYATLGLEPGCTEQQIKKAYRQLALQYHPDRNPGNKEAEERFKEIAVAYGVLIDPVKKKTYDRSRHFGKGPAEAGPAFNYSQEEILRDLFKNPQFNQIYQELFKEFERQGFRSGQRFFEKTFFGGKGVISGFFSWSISGTSGARASKRPQLSGEGKDVPALERIQAVTGIAQKIGQYFLGRSQKEAAAEASPDVGGSPLNLTYDLSLNTEQLRAGAWVNIAVDRGKGKETLKVRVPPQAKAEMRLRLKGKGRIGEKENGDLFIIIHETGA